MPIKWRLADVLNERGITGYRLSKLTGLSVPTCYAILRSPKASRISADTLARLCKALDCQPGDLLEYTKR